MSEFRRVNGVISRDVAGELVLISTSGPGAAAGDFFVLNDAGRVLWDALDRPQPQETLARRLTEEFGISGGIADEDVAAFLADALAHGVVEHNEE